MFAPRYSQSYGYGPMNLMGPSNSMMNERVGPVSEKQSVSDIYYILIKKSHFL